MGSPRPSLTAGLRPAVLLQSGTRHDARWITVASRAYRSKPRCSQLVPHVLGHDLYWSSRRRVEPPERRVGVEIGELNEVGVMRMSGDRVIKEPTEWDGQGPRPKNTPGRPGTTRLPCPLADRERVAFVMDQQDLGFLVGRPALQPLEQVLPGDVRCRPGPCALVRARLVD